MKESQKPGRLFVISAPSGAGKSTLCGMMLAKYPEIKYSISYTTRLPRGTEKNGVEYYFVSDEKFQEMIKNNEFLEWASVHGHYYGTSIKVISDMLSAGADIFLDIDPQGAMQLKEKFPSGVFIFITAPTFGDLRERLIKRNTDSIEVIEQRLTNARKEVEYFACYDYLVVNDESDEAFKNIESIYRAEKLKTLYIHSVSDFIN